MIPPVNMSTNQSKSNLSGDNESRKFQKYEQTIKKNCSLSSPHYGFYIQAQTNLPNFQHSINSLQQSETETTKGCVPNSYMVPSKNPQHQNTMPLHYNQIGTSQYLYHPHYHKYHNKFTGIQPHQSTTIEGRQYAVFLQTPSKLDRHASVPINLVSPVQKSFASLASPETSGDPHEPTLTDQQTPLREQPGYLKPQAITNRDVKENMPLMGERHDEINGIISSLFV